MFLLSTDAITRVISDLNDSVYCALLMTESFISLHCQSSSPKKSPLYTPEVSTCYSSYIILYIIGN